MHYQHKRPCEESKLNLNAQLVESIKIFITDNFSANLRAPAVAERFKLSTSFFHHLFKKFQGQTFQKYLEDLRMEKASELLKMHGLRIKEVMFAAGYRNRATFNKAFKKKFKRSPTHFKKFSRIVYTIAE